jgi:hypothetical protein
MERRRESLVRVQPQHYLSRENVHQVDLVLRPFRESP